MATGETGFSDVVFDLVSVQYHALKGGHDYGQYVRDARNAGYDDIAEFFERVMEEDATRTSTCHDLLAKLSSKEDTGAAVS
ncbi:MAG: acyl carrier protein [Actinomycetota bacterium]